MRSLIISALTLLAASCFAQQETTLIHGCEGLDGVTVSVGDKREGTLLVIARAAEPLHPFHVLDILGIPLACIRFTDGHPVRSILLAANHRRLDSAGELLAMRDVDCTAMVAGVIVGALHGVKAFPPEWVEAVISANKQVYGIDLEQNARAFYSAVYGSR